MRKAAHATQQDEKKGQKIKWLHKIVRKTYCFGYFEGIFGRFR